MLFRSEAERATTPADDCPYPAHLRHYWIAGVEPPPIAWPPKLYPVTARECGTHGTYRANDLDPRCPMCVEDMRDAWHDWHNTQHPDTYR